MDSINEKKQKQRIEIIDALRGIAVLLMVVHHFLYDMVEFIDAPEWLFTNPVFDALHYLFAGVFTLLCGVSSNFSRSNLKRGLIALGFAMLITLVTYIMGMPIFFGVLHMLAFCMLFYGVTHKFWEKIPKAVMPVFCIIAAVFSVYCVNTVHTDSHYLWMFGWTYKGFNSYDYFPLFPWMFIFLFGTWVGYFIKENKFPGWFYRAKIPVFPKIGKYSLWIYIAHQPVLYGLTMMIEKIIAQ